MSAEAIDDSSNTDPQGPQFDLYEFLKQCSEKGEKGIKEWNQWREQNPAQDIDLDGRDLRGWYLQGANFMRRKVYYVDRDKTVDYSGGIYLRDANLEDIKGARASFSGAHLERSRWTWGKLRGCDFDSAHLEGATLWECTLDRCNFSGAILRNVSLSASSLRGAKFMHSDLRGCSVRGAVTDGSTMIWECRTSKETDFNGTCLDNIRLDPGTKQTLQWSSRRMNWEQWYGTGKPDYRLLLEGAGRKQVVRRACRRILTFPVRLFWLRSDYGRSTGRIVFVFFALAFAFAAVYANLPGAVSYMDVQPHLPLWHYCVLMMLRPVYFSVVTMTTLGFGDMYANSQSLWGHILLTLQVLLGYMLLGALVTRFAVLFTAGGPAGRFAEGEPKGTRKRAKGEKGEPGT